MTADTAELLRLILNLIRFGSIAEVDYEGQRVRIVVGGNITGWRPWATLRAGDAQTWWPPTVGEQVILFSPEGDLNQGIAFPAVYSAQAQPPSTNPAHHTTNYSDGAIIQYDTSMHQLTAVLPHNGHASITADSVTSDAPETICTGNLTVQKTLVVNNDVIVNGISFIGHKHGGIQPGGSDSGVTK